MLGISDPTLQEPLAVDMRTSQQASTIITAFHLLTERATITSLKSDYSTHPAAWLPLMHLLQRNAGKLHTLSLSGSRTVQAVNGLTQVLSQASHLQEVCLANIWADSVPSRRVLGPLSKCQQIRCELISSAAQSCGYSRCMPKRMHTGK